MDLYKQNQSLIEFETKRHHRDSDLDLTLAYFDNLEVGEDASSQLSGHISTPLTVFARKTICLYSKEKMHKK